MIGFAGTGAIQYAGKSNAEAVNRGKILGEAVYTVNNNTLRCDPGTKPGSTGASNDEKTSSGIRYMVKTPVNYNASIAHSLLMVYAPGGRNRYESEEYMYLTQEATAAGFIVAYADHRKMTPETIEELAEIPGLIGKKWCIDKKRIFLTGHSDGGTTAMGIAFLNGTKHIPAAIAPSAVGIRGEDLQEYHCPNPLPVMVMHSSQDSLFPGYGKEAIKWWAACNGCDTASPIKGADGCVTYAGCKNNVVTRYCEGTGTHPEWPGKNKGIIDFFRAVNK
jgi:polyhydroxybutyrate depolymerase